MSEVGTELAREAWGPRGDEARYLDLQALTVGLAALPAAGADQGRVNLIVRRHPDGSREVVGATTLTTEEGVPGDGWARRPPKKPDAQLAVMRTAVAELIAHGQALTLFGDNLFVDLDLSRANLPVGTHLRVGEAEVVLTAEPHNGCSKFSQRFGPAALRFVNQQVTRDQNLRGVYWRVVRDGAVAEGAPITVVSRPS